MKKIIIFLFAAVMTYPVVAGDFYIMAKRWSDQSSLQCFKRGYRGQFDSFGTLRLESWRGSDLSEWTCRRGDGTFLYGATGRIERVHFSGSRKAFFRLIFRDSQGQFVTWMDFNEKLFGQWESYGKGNSVYVVRMKKGHQSLSGEIVDRAFGRVEHWRDGRTACVVRDTADGRENGQILTWILADAQGNFHDPATGRFVSCRNPR